MMPKPAYPPLSGCFDLGANQLERTMVTAGNKKTLSSLPQPTDLDSQMKLRKAYEGQPND